MYKNKYLKYKNKYLKLQMLKGGKSLNNIIFNYELPEFNNWYNLEETNSFAKLLELFKNNGKVENDINILVGCTSSVNNDYLRFKDSDFYNLYIDTQVEKFESVKQYYMYTINYSDLDYNRLTAGIVNNIHFDTQVSYFTPNTYFKISEHLLKTGGKLVFNIDQQHGGNMIFKHNLSAEEKINLENEYGININFENNRIEINHEDFFDKSKLDPQYELIFVDEKFKRIPWDNIVYSQYIDYLNTKFNKINFVIKEYTYLNYTYPVPLRYIEKYILTREKFIDAFINKFMNLEEKKYYIHTGIIDNLDEIIERICIIDEVKGDTPRWNDDFNKIYTNNDIISDDIRNLIERGSVSIRDYIKTNFFNKYFYIEGTKK